MEEYNISSKLIKEISYHSRLMYVNLADGKLLMYNNIPHEVFDEFVKADSHDEFYVKNIVPVFSSRRIA